MLEEVLEKMYIAPELLEGLNDLEKETLFCYMRAEQIKRWKIWDAEESSKIHEIKFKNRSQRKGGKSVKWLVDDTGEVVVDEIRSLCFDESEEKEELQIHDFRIPTTETDSPSEPATDKEVKNMSTAELPRADKLSQTNEEVRLSNAVNSFKNTDRAISRNYPESDTSKVEVAAIDVKEMKNAGENRLICPEQRSALRELSSNEVRKVAKQVADWETRCNQNDCKGSSEVPRRMKPGVKIAHNEPADETDELLWRAQLKKANEVQARSRNIARLAREEHRRSLIENGNEPFLIFANADNTSKSPSTCKNFKWIQEEEKTASKL